MSNLDQVWIGSQDASDLLGVSERTVRRQAASYESREVPLVGRGGTRIEFRLQSLGSSAVVKWTERSQHRIPSDLLACGEESELLGAAYERANHHTRNQFQRRWRILAACNGIEGRSALSAWCESWNQDHPDDQVAVPTIYRWRSERERGGFVALLSRETRLAKSTVRDSWFEDFRASYLDQGRLSAPVSRQIALGKAIQRAEIHEGDEFPSVQAFLRRLESEVAPAIIRYAREGRKKFYDRDGIHIERDYSQVPVGRVWVGDTHTWDVFVKVGETPVPQTCYLTLWLDMASQCPMGWHIHTSAPSAENSMRALKDGIERFGIPSEALVDNGREYRNKDFSGQVRGHKINFDEQSTQSVASVLGLRMRFATPRNARAKIIERNFLEIKNKFSRFWTTFKGGNVLEKPERLKEILRRGDIPSFDEVCAAANQFLSETFPHFQHGGKVHQGRTRAQLLEEGLSASPLPRPTTETLSRLVTRVVMGRVRYNGFRLADLQCTWWADWMPAYKGRTICLRYDPENLREAWCYEESGPLIGTAQLRQALDALVGDDDMISKARLREQISEQRREEQILHTMFPGKTADQVRDDLSALGASVSSRRVLSTTGPDIKLTSHDIAAAKVRREARSGQSDLESYAPASPKPPNSPLCWYDEDIVAAAG